MRLVLLALLAVGVRLVLIAASGPPQTWEYDVLARSLLSGHGYVYDDGHTLRYAYYTGVPYVWTTAAVYWLFPDQPRAMLLVQALFAAGTTLVVARLAERLAGPRAALLAGALTALHPALVYYDVRKLHALGLDTLLTTSCLALLATLHPDRWRNTALAGVVFGLAVLQRGSLIPFAMMAALWIAARPTASRERLRAAAVFGAAVLAVLAPWLLRNTRLFGKPVFVTGNEYRFFIGNAPPSVGSAHLASGERVLEAADPALRSRLAGRGEREQEDIFREANRALVREDPGRFIVGVAKKLLSFWTWGPATGVLYPAAYKILYLLFYTALLTAAAYGALTIARGGGRPALLLMLALFASVSAVHAIYYVEMRHRWALEPLLCVLAAGGLVRDQPRAGERNG